MNLLSDRLLAHRLRGFSAHEGSLSALRAALRRGVRHLEVDTRMTADRQVLVFHDTRLDEATRARGRVRDYSLTDSGPPVFRGRPDEEVPTLRQLLEVFAEAGRGRLLHLDVKDRGTEEEHCALISELGISEEVEIVSWSPEILLRVHEIAPELRLSFSYIPLNRHRWLRRLRRPIVAAVRALGILGAPLRELQELRDVQVFDNTRFSALAGGSEAWGTFDIHLFDGFPGGDLEAALARVGGGVNIPFWQLTPEFLETARGRGLWVAVFPVDRASGLAAVPAGVEVIFTNNALLFEGG